MTFRTCLAAAVCAALFACESDHSAHVVLDMGAVRQALSGTSTSVDTISLQVTAPDMPTALTVPVNLNSLFVSFDVPAGPSRLFQATASTNNNGALIPTYWGQVEETLAPDTTLDLTIPTFPAGEVQGTVKVAGTAAVPATVNLVATAVNGRANVPGVVHIVATQGQFVQALPVGNWSITGSADIDGTTYSVFPPASAIVSQGQVLYSTVVLTTSTATSLSLAFTPQPSNSVAGAPLPITVSVVDQNMVRTDLSPTITLSLQGPTSTFGVGTNTIVGATAGVAHFESVNITHAGSGYTLVASAPNYASATSQPFDVAASYPAALQFVGFPATMYIDQPAVSVVLSAVDTYSNPVPVYTGFVSFSSTDSNSTYPAPYTFTAQDAGVHTFVPGVHFNTPGPQTLSVRDTGSLQGSQLVSVLTSPTNYSLHVTGLVSAQAGTSQTMVVTAMNDSNNNVYTGYYGGISITSDDHNAVIPTVTYSFTGSTGVATFTGIQLVRAQSTTVTVTDQTGTLNQGNQTVIITPAPAATFAFVGLSQPVAANANQTFTLTAQDRYVNTATSYTGTVVFTSTDSNVVIPNYTFEPNDMGNHNFVAQFPTMGTWTLKAADPNNPSLTGSVTVNVN